MRIEYTVMEVGGVRSTYERDPDREASKPFTTRAEAILWIQDMLGRLQAAQYNIKVKPKYWVRETFVAD